MADYVTGGATGVAPTFFAVTRNAGGTVVASAPARADGCGYDVQAVFTPASANDSVTISSPGYISGRISGGDKIRMMCEIGLAGVVAANLKTLTSFLTFDNGSTTKVVTVLFPQSTDPTTYIGKDVVMTLISHEIVVPAGYTNVAFAFTATASASGSALTIKIGRLSIEKT